MCRYLPEDDVGGCAVITRQAAENRPWLCPSCGHRGAWTGSAELQALHLPQFAPHLSGGVFQDAQHCVPLLPVHAGRLGVSAVRAQGCRGLGGMESPFLVGNPELTAALGAAAELCDTASTRVPAPPYPSPSCSEPGLPSHTGNGERDALQLPADIFGGCCSSQAGRGGLHRHPCSRSGCEQPL